MGKPKILRADSPTIVGFVIFNSEAKNNSVRAMHNNNVRQLDEESEQMHKCLDCIE